MPPAEVRTAFVRQQKLETTAADLAGQLFDKKMSHIIANADEAIPGSVAKLATSVAELRTTFTAERAEEIKGLLEKDSEGSLAKALEIIADMSPLEMRWGLLSTKGYQEFVREMSYVF